MIMTSVFQQCHIGQSDAVSMFGNLLGDDEDDGSNEHDSRTGGGNGIVDDFPV